jgi:hypothetical protein
VRLPNEYPLALRQADGARTDFALLEAELDFVKGQIAAIPTRKEIWRLAMLSCSGLTILLTLAFWHP